MGRSLRDHGLTLTMLGLFLVFFAGQTVTGLPDYSQDQEEHGEGR